MAALGYVTGASIGGVRVFTATSSQGLAWMHEGLHWASGSRLPIVMAEVNRPLGAPFNLTCGQIDSLAQRDTGWLQLYCESNQEVLDTIIQAYKIAETVSLPVMVCLDGVYLSYVAESVDIPDQEQVDKYLPPYDPSNRASLVEQSVLKRYMKGLPLRGGYERKPGQERASFTGNRYELHKLELKSIDVAIKADEEFAAMFGRSYPLVEEYKCDGADIVLVTTGSTVGTARYVIDQLQEQGSSIGLVKLKMFRPFPRDLVRKALAGKRKVAVIERDISAGQCGIFYQEIKWALYNHSNAQIYGFVAGLGSGGWGGDDITPTLIRKAIDYVIEHRQTDQEAIWLGLEEKEKRDDYDVNTIKIY